MVVFLRIGNTTCCDEDTSQQCVLAILTPQALQGGKRECHTVVYDAYGSSRGKRKNICFFSVRALDFQYLAPELFAHKSLGQQNDGIAFDGNAALIVCSTGSSCNENAIQHGFTDSSRNDYNITTRLSVNPELQMFQIDVVNNGTPLPKGFDKWRYGIKGEKAGPKSGTGEGGYIVKSIVEHYKGEYDVFSSETSNGVQTTVRILLPIYRDNE